MNSSIPPNNPSQIRDRLEGCDAGRLQWSNLHYDYQQFCQEYSSMGWLRRKVVALPQTFYAVTFKLVYTIATTLLAGMRDRQRPCLERVRIYGKLASFYGARSLQEGAATIIRLFHDRYGGYLLEKNRLEIAGYDYVRENDQRQRNEEGARVNLLRPFIVTGHLPLNQALTMTPLSPEVMEELTHDPLRNLILTRAIPFEMAVIIARSPRHPRWQENFTHTDLHHWFGARPELLSELLSQILILEPLSRFQAFCFSRNLCDNPSFLSFIRDETITLAEAITLPEMVPGQLEQLQRNLQRPDLRALIGSYITMRDVAHLWELRDEEWQNLRLNLNHPSFRAILQIDGITLNELKLLPTLTVTQSEDLEANLFPESLYLMQTRLITLADLLRCPRLNAQQRINLQNPYTVVDLFMGGITFQQAIDRQWDPPRNFPPIRVDHGSQNTHTQSVHASATASAIALASKYEANLRDHQLDLLRDELEAISPSEFEFASDEKRGYKLAAAHRCLRRMMDPNYQDHTDSRSCVSNKRLLALIHVALTQRNRTPMSPEGKKALIEALYEIQRGYNLDSRGRDDGAAHDVSICGSGTFNKLIERCVGVIPECEIRFLTLETAALRFHALVIERAVEYLTVNETSTEEDVNRIRGLIRDIRADQNSVETIAPFLRAAVQEEMMREFAELWQGWQETRFRELIDVINDVMIPSTKLDELEARLQSR